MVGVDGFDDGRASKNQPGEPAPKAVRATRAAVSASISHECCRRLPTGRVPASPVAAMKAPKGTREAEWPKFSKSISPKIQKADRPEAMREREGRGRRGKSWW